MKQLTLLSFLLSLSATICIAQPKGSKLSAKPVTPVRPALPSFELMNHVYQYNKAGNTVTALEKASAVMETKTKLMGYGGANAMYVISGTQSPVRILQTDTASFAVNTGGAPMDLVLYKLEVSKKERQAITQKVNGFGFSSKVAGGNLSIPYNTLQLKSGLYQMLLPVRLDKGEYFFATKPTLNASAVDVFAFGVD